MLYLILLSAVSSGFFVQAGGEPIAGAWIGDGASWFGFTDTAGFYQYSGSEPDSLTVHFTGFEDWKGLKPENDNIVLLQSTVINSGETITVTATRGSLAGQIPSTETLDENTLSKLSTGGMSSLNGRVSGVTVREYGGSMPIVSISLRGGDSGQVDYMIDGISVVSQRDGMLTGLFDPAVFSSVEIARGGAAPGGNGTGSSGAVNYLPPLSSQPLSIRVSGLSDGASYIAAKFKETGFSLRRNIGNNGTEGYSSTLLTTKNYRFFSAGFLGSWAVGETEGPDWSVPSDGERKQGQIEGWSTIYGDQLEADISAGASFMSFDQSEPSAVDDTHKDLSLRTSLLWKGPLALRGGFNTTWLESTSTSDRSVSFGSLHANCERSMFRASLGCKIDSFSDIHFSGRATVFRDFKESIFTAELSAYSDHRSPTVNDLYWPTDAFATGNPYLKSERTSGGEAGIDWNTGFFNGRVCAFATTTSNMILWLPDESGLWSPSNLSSAFSRGLETSTGLTSGSFSIQSTFTWNLATDETQNTPREGMIIPYRPEYTWGISTFAELPGSLLASLSARGVAKRFTNRTQTIFLKEYWIAGASIERDIAAGVSLEIALENILDTEYSESNGYNGRGRTLRITAEYTGD